MQAEDRAYAEEDTRKRSFYTAWWGKMILNGDG
jgi:hypothetical protein